MINTFGVKPQSEIYLLNVPELEPSYANTYDFNNKENQEKFFKSRTIYTLKNYTYIRVNSSIKININIDDLHPINYIMYKNKHNKWYYAFVMDKVYINEKTTEIVISNDVFQTYMFDYTLEESYIDRCHVDRWDKEGMPTKEYIDEGLDFGEHIMYDSYYLHTYKDSYVAVCSNPLGKMLNRSKNDIGNGNNDNNTSQGDGAVGDGWKEGKLSAKGFRFIKGFEAFAPNKYYDTYGKVYTIAYGVTTYEPSIFRKLEVLQPVPEEEGAKISYDLKNKNYGQAILDKCKEIGIEHQYQFDALVSLAFNIGVPSFKRASLLDDIKQKKSKEEIKAKWHSYNKSGGQYLEGLELRRKEEAKMFFNEPYEIRPINVVKNMTTIIGKVTENDGNGWLPKEGE